MIAIDIKSIKTFINKAKMSGCLSGLRLKSLVALTIAGRMAKQASKIQPYE